MGESNKKLAWNGSALTVRGNLEMYNGATPTGYWGADGGSFWIGPSSTDKRINWDGSLLSLNAALRVTASGSATAGEAGLYAVAGRFGYYDGSAWKLWMGSTGYFYFGGSSGARLQWNGSRLSGYSASAEQWYADATDGRFKFGQGNAAIDNLGLALKTSYGWTDIPSSLIAWYDDPLDRSGGLKAKITAGTNAVGAGGLYFETSTGGTDEDLWYTRSGNAYRILHTGNASSYGDAAYLGGYTAASYGRLAAANTWTDTQAVEKAGSAIIRLNNTAAANTANLSAVDFYANTDAQLRQSGRIQATFPTITDGSRKSSLSFFAANAGSFGARMTLYGNALGIGNTTPSYTLDVTGDARISTGNLRSANPFSLLNGAAAQNLYAGGILVSNDYTIPSTGLIPDTLAENGIYSKGRIITESTLSVYGVSGFAAPMYLTNVDSTPGAPGHGTAATTQAGMFIWCPNRSAGTPVYYFVVSFYQNGSPGSTHYYYIALRNSTAGHSTLSWEHDITLPSS